MKARGIESGKRVKGLLIGRIKFVMVFSNPIGIQPASFSLPKMIFSGPPQSFQYQSHTKQIIFGERLCNIRFSRKLLETAWLLLTSYHN